MRGRRSVRQGLSVDLKVALEAAVLVHEKLVPVGKGDHLDVATDEGLRLLEGWGGLGQDLEHRALLALMW